MGATLPLMKRYGLLLVLIAVLVLGGIYVSSQSSGPACPGEGVYPVPAGCPGYEVNNVDNN